MPDLVAVSVYEFLFSFFYLNASKFSVSDIGGTRKAKYSKKSELIWKCSEQCSSHVRRQPDSPEAPPAGTEGHLLTVPGSRKWRMGVGELLTSQ